MSYETILVEKKNDVALLQLNRPEKMNALNEAMIEELTSVTLELAEDESVGAVVLTGSGGSFSAGGDIQLMSQGFTSFEGVERMKAIHLWVKEFFEFDKPVIAAVNGAAAGGGFSMAMLCDIILAAESARFSQAFIRIGLVPDLAGLYLLPRLIGLQQAKELVFTGRQLDAGEAKQMGIVSRVLPDEQLLDEALKLASQCARGPRIAYSQAKQILNKSFDLNMEQALALEAYAQGLCFQTGDFQEGIRAFLEKRPAKFKGE